MTLRNITFVHWLLNWWGNKTSNRHIIDQGSTEMFEEDTIETAGVVERPLDYLSLGFSQAVNLYYVSKGIHINI